MKTVQSAYSLMSFGQDAIDEVETCAALSELVSSKVQQLEDTGRFYLGALIEAPPSFCWLEWCNWSGKWSEAGLRAVLAYYRHAVQADKLIVVQSNGEANINAILPKYDLSEASLQILKSICFWSFIDMHISGDSSLILRLSEQGLR